ncbi:hypothetical protein Tco_1379807 [Tanacetum coccineum]
MIASSEFRNSSKNMPRFSSNDMVHNHYLDEARKKTYERDKNSKTSVMPSARFQSTADGSKPKPRITNHSTRSLTIFTGHRFSPNKTSIVYEKKSSRSDLRWKPTGRIFKTVSLRWVPTGKMLASCARKDDSESTYGSNVDIPNIHKCKQTLDLSAADISETSIEVDSKLINKMMFEHNGSSLARQCQRSSYSRYDRSSAVTTANASNKRQQQPDSTSSTSTLATTVTADGNFDV